MIEDQGLATVESCNLLFLIVNQIEIKNVDVLLHTGLVRRLRNNGHIGINQATQYNLANTLTVSLAALDQRRILEKVVGSLSKRTPGYVPYTQTLHVSHAPASAARTRGFQPG